MPLPSIADAAIKLATKGFRVFPLRENAKEPLLPADWRSIATCDRQHVINWWFDQETLYSFPYNIGVAMGQGLIAIDVDVKGASNGEETLTQLQIDAGATLPSTLTVSTPSGGRHHYFKTPKSFRNSGRNLGPGIDVRSDGGYVVGWGSDIDRKAYELADGSSLNQIADLPEWLAARLETPANTSPDMSREPLPVHMDREDYVAAATRYLLTEAPLAVEGVHGDDTTYLVACRVKDLGISRALALELLHEHWNDRCSPPWLPDELEKKVRSAYRNGQLPPGSATPEAAFGPALETHPATRPDALDPKQLGFLSAAQIKPRPWIVEGWLLRKCVSLMIAPPGVGKSTLVVNLSLAIAAGYGNLIGPAVVDPCRVWYYNNEDDREELDRRYLAAIQEFGIDQRVLRDQGGERIYVNSGTDRPLLIARRTGDGRGIAAGDLDAIIDRIRKFNIGVFIADPLVETHEGDENDNGQMAKVARMYRRIAVETNCAVLLVHHTRKADKGSARGHDGDMDSGRGAGALNGVARAVWTLYTMSTVDAKAHGVSEDKRLSYLKLSMAKGNMSGPGGVWWFQRRAVPLGYLEGDEFTDKTPGEKVGVLKPATLFSQAKAVQLGDVATVWPADRTWLTLGQLANLLQLKSTGYDIHDSKALKTALQKMVETPINHGGWKYETHYVENGRERHAVRRSREKAKEAS